MKISNGVRIAIISDSHDNVYNLKSFLEYCQKENIQTIIHCGDLCYLTNFIDVWPKNLEAETHFVYGNADFIGEINQTAKSFYHFKIYGQIGEMVVENKKISFTHFPEKAKILAETGKYDYVFYGHTHKPWEEIIRNARVINPGNLAGIFYQATFAILDLEKNELSLKILEEETQNAGVVQQ